MANPEHLAKLKEGVRAWTAFRRESDLPDLRRVGLPGHDLGFGVNLIFANLFQANLVDANLGTARLLGANLSEAALTSTNLAGADLRGANLVGASLRGANLDGALFGGTIMANTDLKDANLQQCRHESPSFIDFNTLAKSGPLPLAFLRGCGLPEILIDYLPSLVSQPVQFYSCFISYATKDQEFADRLHADLQNKGVRCWFAPHKAQGGKKLHEQIDEANRLYDRLLLILSEDSMNSAWVKTEIANARRKERKEHRRILFPIRLVSFEAIRDWKCFDADSEKDSAAEIREYFIPDFSDWKQHDSYQGAFERLLRDLRAEESLSPLK